MADPHPPGTKQRHPGTGALLLTLLVLTAGTHQRPLDAQEPGAADRALYQAACANCHGVDGTGALASAVAFEEELPDFSSCTFASREPDADWAAVVHDGGPVRGFSRMMPAFGDALTDDEILRVLGYVRSFCGDDAWPPGELNLPRPLVTEKAYPEDEAVLSTTASVEGAGVVMSRLVYERRFGARNQVEFVLPFGAREQTGGGWAAGVGDFAVGIKRALVHSLSSGTIVSVTGEVVLPTGLEDEGFGKGTMVLEPFLTLGQILPSDGFLQVQAGVEIPLERAAADDEAFARIALGKSFTQGRFGRTWSPMVEVLAARELIDGARMQWALLPQMQVTLNTRQHIMVNAGVRIPLTDAATTPTEVLFYVLWDWFDGGLFAGW